MAITIVPTGFEGLGDAISQGVISGAGYALKKKEMEADAKKKDPFTKLQEWVVSKAMQENGATDDEISNVLGGDFVGSKAISQMQAGGFIPNQTPLAPTQPFSIGQGIPNMSLKDAMMKKEFGYESPALVQRDLAVMQAQENAKKEIENKFAVDKVTATEKRAAEKTAPMVADLMNLYVDSMVEMEGKYPQSSEATPEGRGGRIMGNMEASVMQTMPDTQAFKNIGRKMAYEMARAIEGGRVTDQDVDIVWDSLFNSDMPREQAMKQANAYARTLKNKGLTDKELEPLTSLIDMAGGQMMEDSKGNRAFVVNDKVIREF